MATKFENPKYATAARLLGRRSGATVEQLTKGLAEYGVKTDRQARMVIDRMRYGYEAKIENVAPGRFKLG
ncbi:MAG TPA: hypothetical protein VHT03_06380 [Rhizomicrobium sp.]|jgi:hypothetical protein|nr:hypothetical protein [Rhizomicrobium sp.]